MTKKTSLPIMVRTSVLVPQETMQALEALAVKGHRVKAQEIRLALEAHVERAFEEAA